MRPDGLLHQTCRAANLVDEGGRLPRALTEGRIAGARHGCRPRRPTRCRRPNWRACPNVIATGRMFGGPGRPPRERKPGDGTRCGRSRRWLQGEVPPGAVNVDRWTRRALSPGPACPRAVSNSASGHLSELLDPSVVRLRSPTAAGASGNR